MYTIIELEFGQLYGLYFTKEAAEARVRELVELGPADRADEFEVRLINDSKCLDK